MRRALTQRQLLVNKRRSADELSALVEKHAAEIERLAYFDTLTGLPNRMWFEDRLAQTLAGISSKQLLATIFVALDRLKKIDDTLGHAVGDQLMAQVARRLQGCVAPADSLARFDRDEFVLLLSPREKEEVTTFVRLLNETLKPAFLVDGCRLYVTASFGISLAPPDGTDCDANQEMPPPQRHAGNHGGNDYQFYASEMNDQAVKRPDPETSLRRALENENS